MSDSLATRFDNSELHTELTDPNGNVCRVRKVDVTTLVANGWAIPHGKPMAYEPDTTDTTDTTEAPGE